MPPSYLCLQPYPHPLTWSSHYAGKLATLAELASQRADGYKSVAVPLLRGEWNGQGSGVGPGPVEGRVRACVEALLGALPLWFKVS